MTYSRGDIVVVWFPHSNQQDFSRRPAIVVQADNLATGIPQVVIAMITTNLARVGHPSRVFVSVDSEAGAASGLAADSVIMTDNLATVVERSLHSIIGSLPDMTAVDAALRHTLGL